MGKADLDVAVVCENLEFMIERFDAIPRSAIPTAEYCDEMVTASTLHRRYGIARLLIEADRVDFLKHLRRSAELRRDLLLWIHGMERAEAFASYFCATQHRTHPFLDGIACGAIDLVKAIAMTGDAPYDKRYEYEDDYLFARVLFELAKADFHASPIIPSIMTDFERSIDGQPTARFQICQALLASNPTALQDGLDSLIEEHARVFRDKGAGILADPEEYATERFVLVEGLALKVIATRVGIAVHDEDRFMPREAFIASSP